MTAADRTHVFVTGGTGFVGSRIVDLLRQHHRVTALVRSPRTRLPEGVEALVGDVTDPESLRQLPTGTDVVIHLVGIIEETGDATFDEVINRGTEHVLATAQAAGAGHYVQMSALGARDDARFPYLHAKWQAEAAVRASGLPATILRPSVIFGPGDGFITTLAGVVRGFPVIPVVGDGEVPFAPVAIEDVADAFAAIARAPAQHAGRVYELGGAQTVTYEGMIDIIADAIGVRKPKVHLPPALMKAVVRGTAPLPRALRPPVTMEQLKMLQVDNSTGPAALAGLIGREPRGLAGNLGYIRRG